MSACSEQSSHRGTHLGEKSGCFWTRAECRRLWDIAIRQLKNRLATLEQGLDRVHGWELPPDKWVKLLSNKVQTRRTKGSTASPGRLSLTFATLRRGRVKSVRVGVVSKEPAGEAQEALQRNSCFKLEVTGRKKGKKEPREGRVGTK